MILIFDGIPVFIDEAYLKAYDLRHEDHSSYKTQLNRQDAKNTKRIILLEEIYFNRQGERLRFYNPMFSFALLASWRFEKRILGSYHGSVQNLVCQPDRQNRENSYSSPD